MLCSRMHEASDPAGRKTSVILLAEKQGSVCVLRGYWKLEVSSLIHRLRNENF